MGQKIFNNEIQIATNSPDDMRIRKAFGFISALPSEYLIHFRSGRFSESTSGQGRTCFKWWRDTVFIIPTTLKELIFEASQLTRDNVDVRIKGMAVYRISDPRKIYKLINWQNRQASEQKLAEMIGGMCRSTSKWLVSNMNVAECIRKRKEDIAESLRREVSHVVADPENGWGVDLVTIHINDVFIQNEEIFEAMQGIFKADTLRESELAQLEAEKNLQMRRMENETLLAEKRKENELQKAKIEAAIMEQKIALTRQNDEKQLSLEMFRAQEKERLNNFMQEETLARAKKQKENDLEMARLTSLSKKAEHDEIAEFRSRMITIENSIEPQTLEMRYIEKALPVIAESVAKNLSGANLTVFQQNGEGTGLPLNMVLMEVLEVLKKAFASGKTKPHDGRVPPKA